MTPKQIDQIMAELDQDISKQAKEIKENTYARTLDEISQYH